MAKEKKGAIVAIDSKEARAKALEVALGKIEKDFGKGSVMKLGKKAEGMVVEVLPTGILSVDAALGVGGFPKGRIVEIYGPESSGKTTLALHAVASCQNAGGTAAFIDAEHALDPVYAKKLGVDIDELYVSQPDNGEQALDICEALVRSGAIDIVVVDSVAALVPRAEIEGDMGDSHVGLQARLMSQALRKITGVVSNTKCIVIFINQLREKVGVMYGNPETTTGGKALKFYASIRIDIRKSEAIKEGKEVVGNKTKIKIVKNKVAPPFRSTTVEVLYGEGISRLGEVLDYSVDKDLIKKSGSFYSYNGERIGQGRDNVKAWLKANPEAVKELEDKIREELLNDPTSLAEEPVETSDDEDDDDAKEFELDKESSSEPSSEQNNESFDEFVNGVDREAVS
jgi:recombination protein RecA